MNGIAITVVFCIFLAACYLRHLCVSILRQKVSKQHVRRVADANGLSFLNTRSDVPGQKAPSFDQIHSALDHDYRLISYLLRHTGTPATPAQSWERWLLRLDYRIMGILYFACRAVSRSLARKTLRERISVIRHLASKVGEANGTLSRA